MQAVHPGALPRLRRGERATEVAAVQCARVSMGPPTGASASPLRRQLLAQRRIADRGAASGQDDLPRRGLANWECDSRVVLARRRRLRVLCTRGTRKRDTGQQAEQIVWSAAPTGRRCRTTPRLGCSTCPAPSAPAPSLQRYPEEGQTVQRRHTGDAHRLDDERHLGHDPRQCEQDRLAAGGPVSRRRPDHSGGRPPTSRRSRWCIRPRPFLGAFRACVPRFQPGSWNVDGHGISPAIQKAEATADAAAQTCRYVLDVKLCD